MPGVLDRYAEEGYSEPQGNLLQPGMHLVMVDITSVNDKDGIKRLRASSSSGKGTPQLEVPYANADGSLTDYIVIAPGSGWHLLRLIAAMNGVDPKELTTKAIKALGDRLGNGGQKELEWLAGYVEEKQKSQARPFFIEVMATTYNGKSQLKINAYAIRAATSEEAKLYKAPENNSAAHPAEDDDDVPLP